MDTIICSEVRKEAIKKVIKDMLFYSKKKLPESALYQIVMSLTKYEVEKGVSVFMTADRPNGYNSILVDRIDTGKDILYLWWTQNANKGSKSTSNLYALGMTFKYKSADEVSNYTCEDWEKEFPAFSEYISEIKGRVLKVKIFSKAGIFYREVADIPGKWLVQTPVNKYFIPNRPIGKLVSPNKLYIFQPNPRMKKAFYERLIRIE